MQTEQERKAQIIFEHIVETHNNLIGLDPIENLIPEDLKALVDDEFNRYGLNYILVGDFNNTGVCKRPFELKTNQTLQSIDEVKDLLNRKVKTYLRELEKECQTYKSLIYEYLRAYQDEENRKKQPNPYSN